MYEDPLIITTVLAVPQSASASGTRNTGHITRLPCLMPLS